LQTILSHLERNTDDIQSQFKGLGENYEKIRQEFLEIKNTTAQSIQTSGKLKQVYFPVSNNDEYHLLSILTPSAIMYQLKEKINQIRYSDETKIANEACKKDQYHAKGLTRIQGLTAIGFGGTKPQNISDLNSKNHGVALLLSSMPPQFEFRQKQPPKIDFFNIKQQWLKPFEDDFMEFHQLLNQEANNYKIRQKRDQLIKIIFQIVVHNIQYLRETLPHNWSQSETYQHLPTWQKIWLDEGLKMQRQDDQTYIDKALDGFSTWFILAYNKLLKDHKLNLDDIDRQHILMQVTAHKEALK